LSLSGTISVEAAQEIVWPNGAQVAVSLSYDDAIDSHLDHAAPALLRHGLGATFYLIPGRPTVQARLEEWRALATQGFELGNHTLYHGCSKSLPGREWVPEWDDLDKITIEQLRRDILTANTLLQAIDGQTRRTFAAPCLDTKAGGEYYLDAISGDFVALRDLPHGMPAGSLAGMGPVGTSGAELVEFVKANSKPGTLLILVFHGVGGDYLSVSAEAHEELLAYLAAHRDQYWTASYLDIMDHVLGATAGLSR